MASKVAAPRPKNQESLGTGTPNSTLYVKNLAEKINKKDLKRELYMLFSMYGPVLDIVTARVGAKKQRMRGQAHVVFRDIQTSTQAMRGLQGFELFGKEMVIVYGRGQSQIFPKLRGTFEPPASTAPAPDTTALQKSIFDAPPSSANAPSNPTPSGGAPAERTLNDVPHGMKRPRDEAEEDEQEDSAEEVSMDEDEDDAPMDEDDDDD